MRRLAADELVSAKNFAFRVAKDPVPGPGQACIRVQAVFRGLWTG